MHFIYAPQPLAAAVGKSQEWSSLWAQWTLFFSKRSGLKPTWDTSTLWVKFLVQTRRRSHSSTCFKTIRSLLLPQRYLLTPYTVKLERNQWSSMTSVSCCLTSATTHTKSILIIESWKGTLPWNVNLDVNTTYRRYNLTLIYYIFVTGHGLFESLSSKGNKNGKTFPSTTPYIIP